MLDHRIAQLALRSRLLTLSVCTTGSATLASSTVGYTRATGSFVTDGFAKGMEVTPTGFTDTSTAIVADVATLTLTIEGGRTVETASAGRTVAVGLPTARAWENLVLQPVPGVPWVEENYLPGPVQLQSIGPQGALWATPMYVVKVYGVPGVGISAARQYATALLALFPPMTGDDPTTITLSTGDSLKLRPDAAPYAGQLMQTANGYAVQTITIPLEVFSA